VGTFTVLIEVFRGFPQYPKSNATIVPEVGHCYSLTDHFHYTN